MAVARQMSFAGPDSLLDAVAAILEPDVDIVVVRRLLKRRVARRMTGDAETAARILARAVPQMVAVDGFVAEWWSRHGYRDYRLASPHILPGQHKKGGVSIHCDEDEFSPGLDSPELIFGPLSMSIGTSREGARCAAERCAVDWFTAEGNYNGTGLTDLLASQEHPEKAGRELRTQVDQRLGDAVLFATHPRPAFHSVVAGDDRRAQLFEYCLVHVSVGAPPPAAVGEDPPAS